MVAVTDTEAGLLRAVPAGVARAAVLRTPRHDMPTQEDRDVTTDDLNRLEALCAATTAGPWEANPDRNWTVEHVSGNGHRFFLASVGWVYTQEELAANLDFIAAARTAVPALIARVRELEALLPPTFPDFYTCGCASASAGHLHSFCPQHKNPMRTRTKVTS